MARSRPILSPQPTSIPDYDLVRHIGLGAYGDVWLGRNSATGAMRAVKVVSRDRFKDKRPFEREFEGIKKFEEISRLGAWVGSHRSVGTPTRPWIGAPRR